MSAMAQKRKQSVSSFSSLRQYSFAAVCSLIGITAVTVVMVTLMITENSLNIFAAMSGSVFKTTSESLNCGANSMGGTTFRMSGTLCEPAESASGTTFSLEGGILSMEDINFISFSITANNISFGTLTTSAVSTGSITSTVATDAPFGYSSQIYTDGTFRNANSDDINAVSDGAVTAGFEEYGIRTSGTDGQLNGADQGISTTPVIYASNPFASNQATVVTFKAAVSSNTASGNYHQNAYLIAVGRF